jgi:hypothetical protein
MGLRFQVAQHVFACLATAAALPLSTRVLFLVLEQMLQETIKSRSQHGMTFFF